MSSRIARLHAALSREKLDGLIVSGPSNIRYLCGYTGSNGVMLVTRTNAWFYTDFRYQEQIKTEVKGCRKKVLARDLYTALPIENVRGLKRVGVEEANVSLARFRALRKQFRKTRLIPAHDLVLELRRTKEPAEVAAIERAQAATERAFRHVLDLVKPGASEDDLALEIDFQFRRAGGDNAFDSIVASGPNAAKPHAGHSARRLRKGDPVTFDIGCRLGGYCSDMTRTVFVGRPSAELARVYQVVREAQQKAIDILQPGVAASAADAAARDHITAAGYGKYFGHSLGHGVGLEVHERPVLAGRSRDRLAPGDIVTVEPGIYLPGVGGVRIEDMVLVTAAGRRNLTRAPRQLLEL